jgi:hypothetical protein
MSAVAEREVASFEELQAALEKRQAERQQLLSKLAELVQREEAERSALLRAKPDADPYAVGAKAKRFHDERAKTERAIANLEKTIEVLIGHLNEAGAVRAVEGLRELTEQAEKLKKAEDAAWRKAGRVLEELLSVWNPLAENYEERERLRGEAERENLPTQARLDAEVGSAWEQAIDFQGPRVPTDIGSFVEMLLEMVLDPHGHGYRESENGGDRRYGSHLPGLLPDLKGQDRRVDLSARTAGRVGLWPPSDRIAQGFSAG